MLPDLLIAGMMKSGTTTLFRWLSKHPGIVPCRAKEPHFFSLRWEQGAEWYRSLFPRADEGQITVEASQSYSHPDLAAGVARRLRRAAPDIDLVFVLRNPITRARSEYRHEVQRSRERRSFLEAVSDPAAPYLRRSMYRTCLQPFLDSFDRHQMIFLRFEDLVSPDEDQWLKLLSAVDLPRIERPSVSARSTRQGAGWRQATELLVKLGAAPLADHVPKRLRHILRPLFLTDSSAHRELLASSYAALPPELEESVWNDVAGMEQWLGEGNWWGRTTNGEA